MRGGSRGGSRGERCGGVTPGGGGSLAGRVSQAHGDSRFRFLSLLFCSHPSSCHSTLDSRGCHCRILLSPFSRVVKTPLTYCLQINIRPRVYGNKYLPKHFFSQPSFFFMKDFCNLVMLLPPFVGISILVALEIFM